MELGVRKRIRLGAQSRDQIYGRYPSKQQSILR